MVSKLADKGVSFVEEKLRSIIATDIEVLNDASQHIVSSGGKRIRPRIVILSYLAAGGQDLAEVIPLAAAVEMVHTATLVHDDINDHSLTRRGKITVHARWGRTFALLTGDYLFTKVYELMAPFGSPHNEIMAHACIKLVEGETLQAAAAKDGLMDRETYKKIISRKTASLFRAGARMGAILGGADQTTIDALADYAYNLGLTFHVVDDILDIIGDPETMGKPVGADLVQGRGVMATQNGGALGHHRADGATATLTLDPVEQMMANLRESGAVELARVQALETAQRSRDALALISPSPALDELYHLVDLVIERDR
jgi:octaprenyl-diphosphate synthase